jgi:hypothetical protein
MCTNAYFVLQLHFWLPETSNHQDHTLAVHNLNAHKVNTWAKNKQEEGFFIYLLDRGAISPGKESQVF